tara:strand:+ start:980 stop:1507 length:528 start_codon:yes stop_codon:yes gene_type:complete
METITVPLVQRHWYSAIGTMAYPTRLSKALFYGAKDMPSIEELKEQYQELNDTFDTAPEESIKSDLLMAFEYEYPGSSTEVLIDTDEFTAVCPWTGLPDFGTLKVRYLPNTLCIELKSLKYYLLSFTGVGIVQEHAANIILNDLKNICDPISLSVELDYKTRGGLHTTVIATYEK